MESCVRETLVNEIKFSPSEPSLLFQVDEPERSPSKSPRRIQTDPTEQYSSDTLRKRAPKRLIVCCDGTWQDGLSQHRSAYTNVLRMARCINYEDPRHPQPIPQIVFYQSGIGTENNFYSEYVEGTTGGSLADKVEEAYAFIAHNYNPGDEIFLFGFSRGAYTARMVAMFVGAIGVLDRKDMDHFASIFIDFQKLGKCKDQEERERLTERLAEWRDPHSKGKLRADIDGDKFNIKCIGVWDTVGSIGLPEEITIRSKKTSTLFGFPDCVLGEHIEHAFQALALNEMRVDFNCNKFEQSEHGRKKGQTLKQCWFAGCHTDIGGGYHNHDLSDITLIWMLSQVEHMLSVDMEYLYHRLQPVAPWGVQQPHDSATGIFLMASTMDRQLPSMPNDPVTRETIHLSVKSQSKINPRLSKLMEEHPDLVCPLETLEEAARARWPYDPNSERAQAYAKKLRRQSLFGVHTFVNTTTWLLSMLRGRLVQRRAEDRTESRKITYTERCSEETTTVIVEPEDIGDPQPSVFVTDTSR
ncbi:hypothetical protein CVT24_000542 [Panaeolus cyanescens]|uniref:T6SS Phospholipase effector Tle1-like catalytic domain-containing protein n=1 Tax=Panaeolus cyanescens TaxID=181874 RepID=A0A409V8H7_9AGAR|nr:hypothetical protein CVT24_000542 [Panaeolus cyanescens]